MTVKPALRSDWAHMSRRELETFQLHRLRRVMRELWFPFSPYYRERLGAAGLSWRDLKSLDDLSRFPFTTKADILPSRHNPDGPRAFILTPDPDAIKNRLPISKKLALLARGMVGGRSAVEKALQAEFLPIKILFTTGRSASSLPFFLGRLDLALLRESGRRLSEVLGLRAGDDRVVSLFPYAPHLAFWQVAEGAESSGILTLNTGGGRVMGGERILDLIERLEPTAICGMPGYFYHVLRKAHRDGRNWSKIRTVALGGEMVSDVLKRRIVSTLRDMGSPAPCVSSVLGFTESRQCWGECRSDEGTGFHVFPDMGIVEIVDPETGERLPDETTGELVFTALAGRGSLLFRYRTGDIVEGGVTYDPCPACGRTTPRLGTHIQRKSNVKALDLSKVKGTYVNFNTLSALLSSEPAIEEWQLVILKPSDDPFEVDEIELWCSLADGTDEDAFRREIQETVSRATEMRFNRIVIVPLEEILDRLGMETLTKEQRILDKRPVQSKRKDPARS